AACAGAIELDDDLVTDLALVEEPREVVGRAHGLAIDPDDHVTQAHAPETILIEAADPRRLGRRSRVDRAHDGALDAEAPRDDLPGQQDAEAGALGAALVDELRHDAVDGVDRHREADPRRRAGRALDGGVDADEPTGRVDERAAGVARVD